jgi:hypothetical protein
MLRMRIALTVCLTIWFGATLMRPVYAATVIKLNLGADSDNDIQLSGGHFSTVDDGNGGTAGSQNTNIDFSDFLDAIPDIASSHASFSLSGLTPAGNSTTFSGWLVEQDFLQGNLALYAPDNTLLLSAELGVSAVTGPLGAPGVQGLFLASGEVTGGSLKPYMTPNSLVVRMRLPSINAGSGFTVSPSPGYPAPELHVAPLNPFAAGATVEIRADQVPEPAAIVVLYVAGMMAAGVARRNRPLRS